MALSPLNAAPSGAHERKPCPILAWFGQICRSAPSCRLGARARLALSAARPMPPGARTDRPMQDPQLGVQAPLHRHAVLLVWIAFQAALMISAIFRAAVRMHCLTTPRLSVRSP